MGETAEAVQYCGDCKWVSTYDTDCGGSGKSCRHHKHIRLINPRAFSEGPGAKYAYRNPNLLRCGTDCDKVRTGPTCPEFERWVSRWEWLRGLFAARRDG